MRELVEYIAKNLVSNPDSVETKVEENGDQVRIQLFLESSDMGRVIGRKGRKVNSIRTILNAIGMKNGKNVILDVEEK